MAPGAQRNCGNARFGCRQHVVRSVTEHHGLATARQQGYGALRELLDPDTVASLERDLQRLSDERRARDLEGVADLLRMLGPLSTDEAVARGATPAWLAGLEEARRAICRYVEIWYNVKRRLRPCATSARRCVKRGCWSRHGSIADAPSQSWQYQFTESQIV